MATAILNQTSKVRIALFFGLLFITFTQPAHAVRFWCSDQYGSGATWRSNFCKCRYSDGSWEITSKSFCENDLNPRSRGQAECPCSAGQPCMANMCALAVALYRAMQKEKPNTTWEPPPCESGCFDYGVTLSPQEDALDESCTNLKKRTCSKYPPVTPTPATTPTAPGAKTVPKQLRY